MNCPKCGAKMLPNQWAYECGSFTVTSADDLCQSSACHIRELEEALRPFANAEKDLAHWPASKALAWLRGAAEHFRRAAEAVKGSP